jgi:hypothetical protein
VPASILTDEHVHRVFVTTLRSNGFEVVEANDVFGEGTEDDRLLEYCGEGGHVLVTHEKKDFAGGLGAAIDHAGILVYTDANFLRDDPEGAVGTVERILAHFPPDELVDEVVWLDQWRR